MREESDGGGSTTTNLAEEWNSATKGKDDKEVEDECSCTDVCVGKGVRRVRCNKEKLWGRGPMLARSPPAS